MSELRILTPGLGAVSTTLMAGVMLARKGLARPIGALSEYGDLDGKPINDLLAPLDQISFGAWDPYDESAYEVAERSGVLSAEHLAAVADELMEIVPKSAVFDPTWVQALSGAPHVKTGDSHMDLVEQIIEDIESYRADGERLVMVWCGSTEAYHHPTAVHQSLTDFELGLKNNDSAIAPSQLYGYAAIRAGVPFANGAPNVTVDIPALEQMAEQYGVPIAGKDFKTGQTLMKTVIAPGLKARRLGVRGWFSTNILGNRDGLVLDHPDNFRSKEITKLGVLDSLLKPEEHPDLYGDLSHEVRINYYPPAGDNKEGWDNIDIVGWMDYPMQIKVNFLCRDSILAAPIVLDLARFLDLAGSAGNSGIQDWLGFYFKSPHPVEGRSVEHDLFVQERVLMDEIRALSGRLAPVD
ncbi:MAG: inositol-3-phosphate synthase [Acidimicrobiia bacterium]|nr:inositol-3-phosphate synthase [Acidimicrobiia bacterium]